MNQGIKQDKIAEWASSIADLSENLAHQIPSHTTNERDLESVFLYLKLIRHSTIMRDVSRLINANSKQRLSDVFILLRCMLEDFITVYFLKMNGYDRELLLKYTAEGIHNRLRMMEETAELNSRFFGGSMKGLIPFDYIQKEKQRIISNPDNNELFVNKKEFKLKRFPSVREIIKLLPVTDSTIANVPSLISWIQYSEYVHHSIVSARADSDDTVNDVQIRMLKSPMLYAFKLFEFSRDRLFERGFPVQTPPTNVLVEELTTNSINAEELWRELNRN